MIKPSLPKGTRDFNESQLNKRNYIIDIIKKYFNLYGFSQIETPSFENLSTLTGKYGDEGDKLIFKILNSGDFLDDITLEDFSEKNFAKILPKISEKALRYDLTIPFARYFAMNRNEITLPYKRFQIQPVWRADRPQKGRFREFYQCDADVIGVNSLLQEIELINLYQDVFNELKLNVTIKINNRKILIGILEYLGKLDFFIEFTTILDKLDKIGLEKLKEELLKINFSQKDIELVLNILKNKDFNSIKNIIKNSPQGEIGFSELEFIFENIDSKKVEFDLTLARGLNYYTGTILEIQCDDVNIGSLGGGGRYDNLVEIFGVKDISGVGISFGLDRIYIALEEKNLFSNNIENLIDVLFLNFGEKEIKKCLELSKILRKNNISCEIYPLNIKISKQMDYANQKNIKYVIMIGENELLKKELILKNMYSGLQKNIKFENLIENL